MGGPPPEKGNIRALWDALCDSYNRGFEQAAEVQRGWQDLRGAIDPQRHREVADKLGIQVDDAQTWRDDCVQYFHRFSRKPIPNWKTPATRPVPPPR